MNRFEAKKAAKDIPDAVMLGVIRRIQVQKGMWANRGDVETFFPNFPPKVVLAKCRQLIKRDLMTGCTCGCRGDFEITPDGEAKLFAAVKAAV